MVAISDEFIEAVYELTIMVPEGQVATYGQIATYVVSPRYARAVGRALRHLPQDRTDVPWHRIINAAGRVSARGDVHRPVLQEKLLIKEGVKFSPSGRVNLAIFGWSGPKEGWTPPFDEPKPERSQVKAGRRR